MRKKKVVPGLWLSDQVDEVVWYQSVRWANQKEQNIFEEKEGWVGWGVIFPSRNKRWKKG